MVSFINYVSIPSTSSHFCCCLSQCPWKKSPHLLDVREETFILRRLSYILHFKIYEIRKRILNCSILQCYCFYCIFDPKEHKRLLLFFFYMKNLTNPKLLIKKIFENILFAVWLYGGMTSSKLKGLTKGVNLIFFRLKYFVL